MGDEAKIGQLLDRHDGFIEECRKFRSIKAEARDKYQPGMRKAIEDHLRLLSNTLEDIRKSENEVKQAASHYEYGENDFDRLKLLSALVDAYAEEVQDLAWGIGVKDVGVGMRGVLHRRQPENKGAAKDMSSIVQDAGARKAFLDRMDKVDAKTKLLRQKQDDQED